MPSKIFIAGAFPPPVHGMATVNQQIAGLLEGRAPTAIAQIGFGRTTGGKRHLVKAASAVRGMAAMIRQRVLGARTFYGSADDALGGIWTAALIGLARLLGMKIFLHHHSFRYISNRTRLMGLITNLAGKSADHIVLCDHMGALMRSTYPSVAKTLTVPNCVDWPDRAYRKQPPTDQLTIGTLANLSFEKGLRQFVEVVDQTVSAALPVRGVLAGPAAGQGEKRFIEDALERLGSRLEWRGPVSGAVKDQFFGEIDAFVFLTQYRTEAYPLVLLEALVRGVPVLAPKRGCIGSLQKLHSCTIFELDDDCVAGTLLKLREWSADRPSLSAMGRIARQEGYALNSANEEARASLVDTLVDCST